MQQQRLDVFILQ